MEKTYTKEQKLDVVLKILNQKVAGLNYMRSRDMHNKGREFMEENLEVVHACIADISKELEVK